MACEFTILSVLGKGKLNLKFTCNQVSYRGRIVKCSTLEVNDIILIFCFCQRPTCRAIQHRDWSVIQFTKIEDIPIPSYTVVYLNGLGDGSCCYVVGKISILFRLYNNRTYFRRSDCSRFCISRSSSCSSLLSLYVSIRSNGNTNRLVIIFRTRLEQTNINLSVIQRTQICKREGVGIEVSSITYELHISGVGIFNSGI